MTGIYLASMKKKAKIGNKYNQVPHLTQGTIWESYQKPRKHHTQESQEVSPFPAGDHKAARDRKDNIIKKNVKRIHKGTVSKIFLQECLYMFNSAFRCGSRYIYVLNLSSIFSRAATTLNRIFLNKR